MAGRRSSARGTFRSAGCLLIILLAADFFLPMRQLGSFFHIAMNGMAASDKIFRLLDLPEPEPGSGGVSGGRDMRLPGRCGFPTSRSARSCTAVILDVPRRARSRPSWARAAAASSTISSILTGTQPGLHRHGHHRRRGAARRSPRRACCAHVTYVSHQQLSL